MTALTPAKIGFYGPKTRELQRRLSFEHVTLTWRMANVYMYLGSRANTTPAIDDIQDYVLLETRDRAYSTTPIAINIWNEAFSDIEMDLSKFGIIDPSGKGTETFRIHIDSFDKDGLGRYIIVGDVIQLPFFTQDSNLAFWEVTNVSRNSEFENFYVTVTATVMDDAQETAEILGKNSQDNVLSDIATGLASDQATEVPEQGLDPSDAVVTDGDTQNVGVDYRPDLGASFLDDPNAKPF